LNRRPGEARAWAPVNPPKPDARSGRRFVMVADGEKGAIVSFERGRIAHAGGGRNFYSESHG